MFRDWEESRPWAPPKYTDRLISTTTTQMSSSFNQLSCIIIVRDRIFKNRKRLILLRFKKLSIRCSCLVLLIKATLTLQLCQPVRRVSQDSLTLFNLKRGKNIPNRWWRVSWMIWWQAKITLDPTIGIMISIQNLHNNFLPRIIVLIQLPGGKNR